MATRKTPAQPRPVDPAPQPGPGAEPFVSDWRLPSGQDLVSFALATGFAAQPLLEEQPAPAGSASAIQVHDRPESASGARREV